MAKHYYINKNAQITGEHEVHAEDCRYLPTQYNRIYLGYFENCRDAILEGYKYYDNVDGCYYCCSVCHTK